MYKYIAFLRGINVGGNHKVPMANLKEELLKLGFKNIITILNSGNIIFEAKEKDALVLEKELETQLGTIYGFPIPTIVRTAQEIQTLITAVPFKNIEVTKDIRLYITLVQKESTTNIDLPWISDNHAYKVIDYKNRTVLSVLDVSISKTTKAMKFLEINFGKNITTRNWNTLLRIDKKLKSNC